jgi:putative ABC transport system permease protein
MEQPGGDVTDNFEFEMEGVEKKAGQTLNIFTADSGFFGVFGIHPIAGTTDVGYTPSQQWESDAMALNILRTSQNPDPAQIAKLQTKLGNYREKYILNRSALNHLGITNPQDAIGKRFRLNFFMNELFPEGEVVGVVPDFHYTSMHNEEKPLVIIPRKMFSSCYIIRINPAQRDRAITTIESVWKKINPGYPLQYEYLTDSYRRIYADEYTQTRVLSMFALISILLSCLGIFAMAAFTMQRRVKEIGIRKINGARVWEIMMMLNREFLKWVAIGFIIAIPVSWYAMDRWLESFAYKTPLSWWIFALAGLLAFVIALMTVSWLSWRAATRNPVESLRYE